jgi:hypothetical protein
MAITTLDGVLGGMQAPQPFAKAVTGTMVAGRAWSTWSLGGYPAAGSFDSTLAGVALSSSSSLVSGQIPFYNPSSGYTYLSRFAASATIAGTLVLCDRLWHNGGFTITSTGSQTVTSATFPARDLDASTNGRGVFVGVEVSVATTTNAPTLTMTYVNSTNTGGSRTSTNLFATAASSAVGSFYMMGLQSGDLGVRQVSTLTLSASWTAGTINMVAYRPIAYLPLTAALVPNAIDALTGGLPRLYDGTVPFLLFIPSTTTTSNISGSVVYTQG